jgi:ABC-2 type transport system permease protein
MLYRQTLAEFRRLWRLPSFSLSTLCLPIIFFVLLGLPNLDRHVAGVQAGPYLVASFATYAVTSVMLATFGISLSAERAQRLDILMRASPLPPLVYLLAKVLTAYVALLFAFARFAGGILIDPKVLLTMAGRLLLGAPAFMFLGCSIAYVAGPSAASAVLNLVYIPLAFASGLFIPLEQLPQAFQQVAPYLFTYHYARLAWSAVGVESVAVLQNLAWLAAYAAVFLLLALSAFHREETRTYS